MCNFSEGRFVLRTPSTDRNEYGRYSDLQLIHGFFRSFAVIRSCFENGTTDPQLPVQLRQGREAFGCPELSVDACPQLATAQAHDEVLMLWSDWLAEVP